MVQRVPWLSLVRYLYTHRSPRETAGAREGDARCSIGQEAESARTHANHVAVHYSRLLLDYSKLSLQPQYAAWVQCCFRKPRQRTTKISSDSKGLITIIPILRGIFASKKVILRSLSVSSRSCQRHLPF